MKWTKVDSEGKPAKRNCNSFMPHDYVSECKGAQFKIINNSFSERKGAWVCTCNGKEFIRCDTLKGAKIQCENLVVTWN